MAPLTGDGYEAWVAGVDPQTEADHVRPVPEATMPDQPSSPGLAMLALPEGADPLRAPVATSWYWRHLGAGPRSFRLGRRVVHRLADPHAWIKAQDHLDGA